MLRPEPKRGGIKTIFTVKYVNDIRSDNAGDQFHLFGPRGTRCHGLVGYTPTGHEAGTQTIRMGPGAKGSGYRTYGVEPEDYDDDSTRPLSAWCRGVYRGRIEYENADGEVEEIKARFRFRVR